VNVDFLTLACLRDRLDGLLGARVQRVVLPDARSIGLELFAAGRHQLLVSADPQAPRMYLVPHKLRRGVESQTPLLLLLRKWVRGSRMVDVTQPPWERILELHFDGDAGRCRLVAELIGRRSNLILVDPEGRVLDAMRRVGPTLNRHRVTLPGEPYDPPPLPRGSRPLRGLSMTEWSSILASMDADTSPHRQLARQLLGVSPMVARELLARAEEARNGVSLPPDQLARRLQQVAAELLTPLEDGSWAPHVALDEAGVVIAFAPYRPAQFERLSPTASISEAMWRYFAARATADPYAAARLAVGKRIDAAHARARRTLDQLQDNLVGSAEIEALREAGELLLAYQGQVSPQATEVTLPDYAGSQRTLALDAGLTPVQNAQVYFRRYRKALRAAEEVPARIGEQERDLAYLEQLAADLALAETRPEIDAVYQALADAGWTRRAARGSAGQVRGPRRIEIGGFTLMVGRNAQQNAELTFKRAAASDLWLHARGMPGAHVVIRSNGADVPEDVLNQAAALAAYYSAARDEQRVAVDVTERRRVRRLGRGRPGLVSYTGERTLWVEPRAPRV
jgi:predicted ribosome quality control (RQC) complex YloA/Tae2 family protein